jgi:hypothetical protein
MKRIIVIIPFFFLSFVVDAQSDVTKKDSTFIMRCSSPVIKGSSPLLILMHEGNKFSVDTIVMHNGILEPDFIKSINIMKDKEGLEQFGSAAKNGVIVFTLIEKNSNKSINALRKYLKAL